MSSASKLAGIIAGIYLAVFFALSSGLVNSIIEGRSSSAFILPSRSVQTIGETIVVTLILFIGMAGAFLLYRAGKTISPKAQQAQLAAGLGIIGLAMLLGFVLVNVKLG
jgi:hypothetical protein